MVVYGCVIIVIIHFLLFKKLIIKTIRLNYIKKYQRLLE
jgi:hypothetical protein